MSNNNKTTKIIQVYGNSLEIIDKFVQLEKTGEIEVKNDIITTEKEIIELLNENFHFSSLAEEEMWVVGFTNNNKVIGFFKVGQGNTSKTINNAAGIFKRLLLTNAQSFAMFHNHPSGFSKPSKADLNTTSILRTLGLMMEIELIDHVVVGKDDFTSTARILKERGEWD